MLTRHVGTTREAGKEIWQHVNRAVQDLVGISCQQSSVLDHTEVSQDGPAATLITMVYYVKALPSKHHALHI